MSISFDLIPVDLRVPGMFAEFDSSNASQGVFQLPVKGLIPGQKTAEGSKSALEFVRVTNVQDARDYFGPGSMLALMFEAWHRNNSFSEVYCVALDDDAGATAAQKTVTFSGAATAAGYAYGRIGGKLARAGVAVGDAASDVASGWADAVNANENLPMTAVVADAVVTLTAKNKGDVGNDIDIRFNYYDDESFPEGITATLATATTGAGNPLLDDVIAAMGDEWYNFIAMPYTDSTSLVAMETVLDDRWGPMNPIDGRAFAVRRGTHSELGTFGDGRNSAHVCCMTATGVPTNTFEHAAALAAKVAYHGGIDPARPFTTLELEGVLPPAKDDRFTLEERNLLLFDGISTFTVDSGGRLRIEKLITMYKQSANGADDESYLYLNTLLTLSFIRYDLRTATQLRFPRYKLADDGTRFGAGQKVVTPKSFKGFLLSRFRLWEEAGLAENVDQFKRDLVVERDSSNRNRLNTLLPPDLMNQFDIGGFQIQFIS